MIIGIGTDICDTRRIEKVIDRFDTRFIGRVFTIAEQLAASSRKNPAYFYAKRFAAKEAVYKALSKSDVGGRSWHDAEILNNADGAPFVTLSGRCKTALEALTPDGYKAQIDLSLSDELPYALAFIVLSAIPNL